MEIKEYIEQIVDNGRIEDMQELSDIIYELMEEISKYNIETYNDYKAELCAMANGNVPNPDMAQKLFRNMRKRLY